MPGSILVIWPHDPALDTAAHVARARAAAPEREPTSVLVALGDEVLTVADVRLDNAAELKAELALPASCGDHEVIDACYDRWGEDFPGRIAGDLAWARWDPRARQVLLVRDHMGMRPLVYARFRDGFAAATDIRSLQALPGVDTRWHELYVAMYFTDIWLDRESTAFVGIRRLPPGSLARVRDVGRRVAVSSYWQLPSDDLRLSAETDYLERFRDLFVQAVRTRLPDRGAVATELSGGLDSTVVTAAAAEFAPDPPVLAMAASFAEERYEEGAHDEGEHRRWAREDPRIDLVEMPASHMMAPGAVERLMAVHGTPMAPVMDLIRLALWTEAAGRGAGVVLDGYDGDTTVNYGFERLIGLVRRGRLVTLARETLAAYRKAGRRGLYETGVLLTNSSLHSLSARVRPPRAIRDSLVSPALLERSGFWDRYHEAPGPRIGDVRGEHTLDVLSGNIALATERLEVTALAAGVQVRHPFFDRRLVEFCVGLPPDLLFRERMPRWIERAALEGFGPPSVLWRHDKGGMPNGLAEEALTALDTSIDDPLEGLDAFVDVEAVQRMRVAWQAHRGPAEAVALYPLYEFAHWRRRPSP